MTTIAAYVNTMRTAQNQVALKAGWWPPGSERPDRIRQTVSLGMVAVLAKVLVDKGLVTDAELQAGLAAAIAEAWPAEPDVTP